MADNTAKLTFWGVRGSTPTLDRATWRYGGNTPCLELKTSDGDRIILDCGTGLRTLGKHWSDPPVGTGPIEGHILVTHYHWDHIQGIPFFAPFYSPQNKFHFYSFRSESLGRDSLRRVLEAQMAHPYFPVDLGAMSAAREFAEIAGGDSFNVGKARVKTCWLNHPQGCLGFRIETPAGVIVYTTDNEHGDPKYDRALRELAAGADLFINDAQFAPESMAEHKGWGHSTWLEGVRIANEVGARNLVLFHHDPDSSDKAVDSLLRDARGKFEFVWAAAEGMVMTLKNGALDVVVPEARDGLRREANFPARVTGFTQEGRAFDEDTVIGELSIHGALIYLDHAPKLQSEVQVTIENPGNPEHGEHLVLHGYVVRTEAAEKGRVGVGIVFME